MIAVGALYALCLWVLSSLLRGKGVLVAAAGAFAFVAAARAARAGRRAVLHRRVFVSVLAAAGVALAEAALRLRPGLLSGAAANAAHGGYHGERDGIYEPDPYLGSAMRPGRRRRMYWNGHVWHHEANARGFRGPLVARADAVFLGDSMVYGHGVEEPDTVPARFAHWSGLTAANLGQQGSAPVQALERLRRTGLALRPRVVLLCVHPNDVTDPLSVFDAAELQRFVREPGYRPRAAPQRGPRPVFDFWLRHVALPLATARALRAAVGSANVREPDGGEGDGPLPPVTVADSPPGWAVLRQAVREIGREAREAGARLVVFDLGYPAAFTAALEAMAGEAGGRYSDAGRVAATRALAGADVYLRRDGHWSPAGSDIVARALAEDARVDGRRARR